MTMYHQFKAQPLGGIGEGEPITCSFCNKIVKTAKGWFENGKMVYKCGDCR